MNNFVMVYLPVINNENRGYVKPNGKITSTPYYYNNLACVERLAFDFSKRGKNNYVVCSPREGELFMSDKKISIKKF